MNEILAVSMKLCAESFDLFQNDESFKDECKKRMAIQLAEKLLESNYTTFTYTPEINIFGAVLRARIDFPNTR